jgi:hypothetical protein
MAMKQSKRIQGKRTGLLVIAIAWIVFGLLFNFLIYLTSDLSLKLGFLAVGIGIVSIGVGGLGMWIARESDDKMKALANLEFDEKVVAMENYLDEFAEPTFTSNALEPEYKKFLWDLRAATHVARWADDNKRREARQRLDKIIGHLTGKMDGIRLSEVEALCNQIWPDGARQELDMLTEEGRRRLIRGVFSRAEARGSAIVLIVIGRPILLVSGFLRGLLVGLFELARYIWAGVSHLVKRKKS